MDTPALFAACWDEAVAQQGQRSPSYSVTDYTATGRASKAYGGKRNLEWWADNGHTLVDKWIEWRQAHPDWRILDIQDGVPAIELQINCVLPGDIPVKMFIDRVFVLSSGQVVVLDLKTGRTPETGEQLGLYRVGLGLMFNLWPSFGYWWSPDKGHSQPIPLEEYTPGYFGRMYAEAARGMNAGVYLPKPQNNCRAWCGVARYCHAVGGREAPGVDPLAS